MAKRDQEKEIWSHAADNEAASAFRCKVEANWQEYRQELLSLPKEDLIEKAGEIAAVRLTRDVLTHPSLGRDDREYLDRFVNPLKVVSDSWFSVQDDEMTDAFYPVMWALQNTRDAEQDYELELEYQPQEPEQTI